MQEIRDEFGNTIQILGRAGLLFKTPKAEYFVDSEGLAGPEYGIVIYQRSIKKMDGIKRMELTDLEKQGIVNKVIELLKSSNIYVEII
jgi:hypothetical protein